LPRFPGYDLLRARQHVLDQRWDEARALYDRLIEGTRCGASLLPRQVLLGEYPAARVQQRRR